MSSCTPELQKSDLCFTCFGFIYFLIVIILYQKLRSFQLEVQVEPKYHPKIIGRGGTVISRIRMNHDVQIQFPEKNSEQQDIIVVTGYQKNAEAAKEEILALVAELVCTTNVKFCVNQLNW